MSLYNMYIIVNSLYLMLDSRRHFMNSDTKNSKYSEECKKEIEQKKKLILIKFKNFDVKKILQPKNQTEHV